MSERILPSATEAEEAVIGCLFLSPVEVYAIACEMGIGLQHFLNPSNCDIFECIVKLHSQNRPVEFVTVATMLRETGKLEGVGGPARLSSLSTSCAGTAFNARKYLEDLHRMHVRRRLVSIGEACALGGYAGEDDPFTVAERIHADITSLISKKGKRPSVLDVMREIIEEVRSGKSDAGLLPIGMEGIRGRLQIYRGDLLIISAPTSCGKSSLAAQMAFDQAMQGRRVALYPLEMAQKQVLKRAIAQLGGDNADWVRNIVQQAGNDPVRIERMSPLVAKFVGTANTILQFDPHMRDDLTSLEAITADIRAEHAKKPFSFILIDYLQLMTTSVKAERKQLQIAHITQSLKRLASELECVICLPTQVNADGSTREARDIENDAAALVKICGKEEENGDVKPGRVTIWKQREGDRYIDLPLVFNGMLTRFEYKA